MAEVTLLGPSARPMICVGDGGAWKTRTIRGIMCSFQWMDMSGHTLDPSTGQKGESVNACMALLNPRSMRKRAFIVPQQLAYLYGTRDGHATPQLLTAGFQAAVDMEVGMNRSSVRNVIDIIIEGLPDLILMPSEPPNSPEVLIRNAILGIEASAKVNGRVVHEEVL